jgi:2-oxoglutarate dehydrogenase E2 component (dihydrolipoamide succinyltransferase)
MAKVELIMPKMGESVAEATVIKWLKNVGETIEMDESVLEIATDKVDSEVPSAVEGVLVEQLFSEDDVVKVGQAVAIIETDSSAAIASVDEVDVEAPKEAIIASEIVEKAMETTTLPKTADSNKFFSPLVRSIAQQEGMSMSELESISGTGKDHRVTKKDILNYLTNRSSGKANIPQQINTPSASQSSTVQISSPTIPAMEGDEIIEMDRMRKMIANHMVMSKHVSPQLTSFVEAESQQ